MVKDYIKRIVKSSSRKSDNFNIHLCNLLVIKITNLPSSLRLSGK